VPNYSFDNDPGYWQFPERFRAMVEFAPEIGVRGAFYPMGEDSDDVPMAVIMDMEPGYVIGRHSHPCERFEVIARGTLDIEGRTYVAGDVLTAKPYEFYGPKTAGPDGCMTIEIFSKATGAYTRIAEGPDGEAIPANLLTGVREALHENGVPKKLRSVPKEQRFAPNSTG
jgi:anti-sigma factor ChrR (cupin superfamily)